MVNETPRRDWYTEPCVSPVYYEKSPQIQKLLGEDRNRQIRLRRPGNRPSASESGAIHHHRDKTLALVDSMICIGTWKTHGIKFARHILISEWVLQTLVVFLF